MSDVWTKRDGTKVAIAKMTDSHVWNTYRMLVKANQRHCNDLALAALGYAGSAPDGAAMAAESEADWLMRADVHELARAMAPSVPWLRRFRREMRDRKLLAKFEATDQLPEPRVDP